MTKKIIRLLKIILLILCGYILLKFTTVTASSVFLQFILTVIVDVCGILLIVHAGCKYFSEEEEK